MKSIKQNLLLVILAAIVVGCSSMPDVTKTDPTKTNSTTSEPSKPQSESASNAINNNSGEAENTDPSILVKQSLLGAPDRFLQSQPAISSSVKQQINRALKLKKAKELKLAEEAFKTLASTYPTYSMLWLHLGDIAYQQGQIPQAIEHYQQAVQVNPNNYFAHNRLGHLLRTQGQFATALLHYQQAIEAWPGFAQAYLNRGILQDLYRGDKAAALEDYQTYQLLTDSSDSHINGWIADLGRQIDAQTQGVTQ